MTDIREIEDRLAERAHKALASALDKLLAEATAKWVREVGGLDEVASMEASSAYQKWLLARLKLLPASPAPRRLLGALGHATAQGVEVSGGDPADAPRLSAELVSEVRSLPRRVERSYSAARALLAANGASRYSDVVAVVGAARGALTSVDRTVRWAANRAYNEGVSAVAADNEWGRLWVPERNACLYCLAYAGMVAAPGRDFPAGITYGDKPLFEGPVSGPPLHPNCRCELQVWKGADGELDPEYPATLRREADRAVLRGTSGYGSESARVRAAERLLVAGVDAPKSVKKKAEQAVRTGSFS